MARVTLFALVFRQQRAGVLAGRAPTKAAAAALAAAWRNSACLGAWGCVRLSEHDGRPDVAEGPSHTTAVELSWVREDRGQEAQIYC